MQVRVAALVAALVSLAPAARADDAAQGAQAKGMVASVESAQGRIARMLRVARADRDGARTACASDGLSRANASLRRARLDARDWAAAHAREDADGERRAMVRLAMDRDSAQRASREVDQCFDVDHAKDDRTEVRLVVDPD